MKVLNDILFESSLSRIHQHIQDTHVGIITAHRGEKSPTDNIRDNSELHHSIRAAGYGLINIKGRYIENHGTPDARPSDEHSFLVVGPKGEDKNGNFKKFLTKHGEKYNQDSVLYKPHDKKSAVLIGTNKAEFPGKGKEVDIGEWHANRTPEFHSVLMKHHKSSGRSFSFEGFDSSSDVVYEDFKFILPVTFSARKEQDF